MIRQFADGGEAAFQRMLPWAADLERSGHEVAKLPDEFWSRPDRPPPCAGGRPAGTQLSY
jgi:hypothetical protein